jgi:hypothetical protein
VIHPNRHILKALLILAAVASLAAAFGCGPAVAKSKTPCWKTLINDWYDGRIDGTYPIHCYRDALNHLPTDIDAYSSARDDIRQALQKRITQSHTGGGSGTSNGGGASAGGSSGGGGGAGPTSGGTSGGGSNPGGSTGGGSNPGGGGSSGGSSGNGSSNGNGTSGGGNSASGGGPINSAFDAAKPKNATSLPIPLIVLGCVALLLMAAGGGGYMVRRTRLRKAQLASPATAPPGPAEQH